MGVGSLTALDFDPDSVTATSKLLGGLWKTQNYKVSQHNILTAVPTEKFDVVYSWGVLHHTGDMWEAIRRASQFTKVNGTFVIAIYQKTMMCGAWKILKRIYNRTSPAGRQRMEGVYTSLMKLKLLLQGKSPAKFIEEYNRQRGMNWSHDIVDWLGGHPYESATPEEIIEFVQGLGFQFSFGRRLNKTLPIGFFGSGCGEYVFKLNGPK